MGETISPRSALRLRPPARELKRRLGPMAWGVLEDVALDAVPDEDGRLVATTSTRRVAENLGLAPGTAGRALTRLRQLGLVRLVRQSGDGGRFGLSAYVLSSVPGLEVGGVELSSDDNHQSTGPPHPVQPGLVEPRMVEPCLVEPCLVEPRMVEPCVADEHMEPAATKAVAHQRRPSAAAPPGAAQLSMLDTAGGAAHETTEGRRR